MMATCSACGNHVMFDDTHVPASFKCTVCGYVNQLVAQRDEDEESLPVEGRPTDVPLLHEGDSTEGEVPVAGPVLPREGEPGYELREPGGEPLPSRRGPLTPAVRTGSLVMKLTAIGVFLAAIGGLASGLVGAAGSGHPSAVFGLLASLCVGAWLAMSGKLLFSGAGGFRRGDAPWRWATLGLAVLTAVVAPGVAYMRHLGRGSVLSALDLGSQLTLAVLAAVLMLAVACYLLWVGYLNSPRYFLEAPIGRTVEVAGQLIVCGVLGAMSLGLLVLIEAQPIESEGRRERGAGAPAAVEGVDRPGPDAGGQPDRQPPAPAAPAAAPAPELPPKSPPGQKWTLVQTPVSDPNDWFSVRPPQGWPLREPDQRPAEAPPDPTASEMIWVRPGSDDQKPLILSARCTVGTASGTERPQVFGHALGKEATEKEVLWGDQTARLYEGPLADRSADALVLIAVDALARRRYQFALVGPYPAVSEARGALMDFARTVQTRQMPTGLTDRTIECTEGRITLLAPADMRERLRRDEPDRSHVEFSWGRHVVLGLTVEPLGEKLSADPEICGQPLSRLQMGSRETIGRATWQRHFGPGAEGYVIEARVATYQGRRYVAYGWCLSADVDRLRVLFNAWLQGFRLAEPAPAQAVPGPGAEGPAAGPPSPPSASVSIPDDNSPAGKLAAAQLKRDLEEGGRHDLPQAHGGPLTELLADARGRYVCAVYRGGRTSRVVVWSAATGLKLIEAMTPYGVGAATVVPGSDTVILGDHEGFVRWFALSQMGKGEPAPAEGGPPSDPGTALPPPPGPAPGPIPGPPGPMGLPEVPAVRLSAAFPVESWKAADKPIVAMCISADRSLLAVASDDATGRVWEIRREGRPQQLGTFSLPTAREVRRLAFSGDGQKLAAVTDQQAVELLEWREKKSPRKLAAAEVNQWTDAGFSPDGNLLAAGAAGGGLRVWEAKTQKLLKSLKIESPRPTRPVGPRPPVRRDRRPPAPSSVGYLAFSPDGSRLALSQPSGIWVWKTDSWECVCRVDASAGRAPGDFRQVAFLAGADRLLAAHSSGKVELLDLSQLTLGGGGEPGPEE